MGQAFYRKYRSKSLDEIVGQEHITSTLSHALKTGALAHAYLFTGPRGTGKTSIARILAHEINGLPYDDDSTHLDIIEIDAASNRRIDEIRELRDKVNLAPSSAKYKVYIIDEVHMLTREAFNALLKTLEEPPEHVVFILATTESHKLPETIISRTQRFMFKPVDLDKVTGHLKAMAKSEGLDIDDEALGLIAAYGEGSFRDSISLLDQTRGSKAKVTADFVRSLIGQPPTEAIEAIYSALANHTTPELIKQLSELRQQGFAAPQIAKQLGVRIRQDILQGKAIPGVFNLLQKLLTVPTAYDPDNCLEILLLEQALSGQALAQPGSEVRVPSPTPVANTTPEVAKPAQEHKPVTPVKPEKVADSKPVQETSPEPARKSEPVEEVAPVGNAQLDEASWPQVMDRLKKTHNTLYGIARMTRPVFLPGQVEIYCKFPFHQRRLNEVKNRDIILDAIRDVTGQNVSIKCLVEEKPAENSGAGGDSLSAISAVFGGGEVLDS